MARAQGLASCLPSCLPSFRTYVRTNVPPIGQVVAAWQQLAAGLDSPGSAVGARMRDDHAGFYCALREWLGALLCSQSPPSID